MSGMESQDKEKLIVRDGKLGQRETKCQGWKFRIEKPNVRDGKLGQRETKCKRWKFRHKETKMSGMEIQDRETKCQGWKFWKEKPNVMDGRNGQRQEMAGMESEDRETNQLVEQEESCSNYRQTNAPPLPPWFLKTAK